MIVNQPTAGGGGERFPSPAPGATVTVVSTTAGETRSARGTHSAPLPADYRCQLHPHHGSAAEHSTPALRAFLDNPTGRCVGCLTAARDYLTARGAVAGLRFGQTWHAQTGPGVFIVTSVSTDRHGAVRGAWGYDPAHGVPAESFLTVETLLGCWITADEVCDALAGAQTPETGS